jgi:hypothetical protein
MKNCNLLIDPSSSFKRPKLQEKPSALKREQPALQHMKFYYFFLFLLVNFALLDPDPDPATQIMRIYADPDLKPCLYRRIFAANQYHKVP